MNSIPNIKEEKILSPIFSSGPSPQLSPNKRRSPSIAWSLRLSLVPNVRDKRLVVDMYA